MGKEDVFEDPQVKKMLRHFKENVLPNIADSTQFAALISGKMPDAKMCLEIGAAVLLDKPIIAICFEGAAPSQHLLKIATKIVEVEDLSSPRDMEKVRKALKGDA